MEKILVALPVSEENKALLEAQAPDDLFVYTSFDEVTKEMAQEATIVIGNVPADFLTDSPNLKWLQLNSAGADAYMQPGILPEEAQLTNATGAYGLAISEHMLGCLLAIQKKLFLYYDNQKENLWRDEGDVTSVYQRNVLILGFGDIGQSFGRLVKAMGAHVIGVRRNKAAKPDWVDKVVTLEELDSVIPEADVIAMSLPGTNETYHLMNEARFNLMKKDAILLNVGRGTAIDQGALVDALNAGKFAAASIDVTDPEPLPSDSPLWTCKNLYITPHISGQFHLRETFERIVRIAAKNLAHFKAGEELDNQVDFATGYRRFKG